MNARDNPFRTERLLRIRYRFHDFTRDELMQRLARSRYRGAIVGPEGSGKTTLLEDLADALSAAGMPVCLLRASRGVRPAPVAPVHIILLDSAERLSAAVWLRFRFQARHAAGLIITAHRPGRLPTVARLTTTPDLLAGIAADLTATAFPLAEAERLHNLYAGNLRSALLHLYDDARSTALPQC